MTTYRYTDQSNTVVHVIDADGISRKSMMAENVPAGEPILPAEVPPTPVPAAVTMRQARLALLQSGLLAQVNAAVAAMPGPDGDAARIEWEFSSAVERHRPLVQGLGAALGLTEQQLDDLFILAASL